MAKYIFNISELDAMLYEHAIRLITCFDMCKYDKATTSMSLNKEKREQGEQHHNDIIIPKWLAFGTGFECLLKSVLIRHGVVLFLKNNTRTSLHSQLLQASNLQDAKNALAIMEVMFVTATQNSVIEKVLEKKKITHIHDIYTQTIGSIVGSLKQLVKINKLSDSERNCIHNSLQVFINLRTELLQSYFLFLISWAF